jgi:hypothetical protein
MEHVNKNKSSKPWKYPMNHYLLSYSSIQPRVIALSMFGAATEQRINTNTMGFIQSNGDEEAGIAFN